MADSVHYSQTDVKAELKIASGDTADDTDLDRWGLSADRLIDNKMRAFKNTLPLTGGELTEDLAAASIAWVSYRYKLQNKAFESAKQYKDDFNEIIKTVTTRLQNEGESRTLRTAVLKSYSTDPLASE